MFWNLKEGNIKIGNGNMDYAAFGSGERSLVIIPGLSLCPLRGAGASLAFMYRMLAKDFRVYVIDKISPVPDGYTVSDIARDTAYAIKELGIERAAIFGVSLGGMVAQRIAIDYPELTESLVLAVTAARSNPTIEAVISRWLAFAQNNNFGGIITDMMTVMYSERYVKKYRILFPILSKFYRPKDPEGFIRLAKSCLTCNTYADLDKIKCKSLVLGGECDMIVTPDASREIAEKIGCEIHMYEGLGHSAYEEAPDFNKRICSFLGAVHSERAEKS